MSNTASTETVEKTPNKVATFFKTNGRKIAISVSLAAGVVLAGYFVRENLTLTSQPEPAVETPAPTVETKTTKA